MQRIKDLTVYVIPSWACNLNCPHCFVKNQPDNYNEELFINALQQLKIQYPTANFTLHGGEPTFNKNRLKTILSQNIITSITTNCITTDLEIYDWINKQDLAVATSWNTNRFITDDIFKVWLSNIKQLKKDPLLLITLDKDLISLPLEVFFNKLYKIQDAGVIDILFECLVDNTLDDSFQTRVDEWLCEFHNRLHTDYVDLKINSLIETQILNWDFRCNSKTLLPNGIVRDGCTMGNECNYILNECLGCDKANVCKPCVLHTRCSFFPKFYIQSLEKK